MISWIVASHDPAILQANLLATLQPTLDDDDEIVVVADAPSIAVAYNRGTRLATRPIRCFVHHDVQVLDPARLRGKLAKRCGAGGTGMVGVVGSTTVAVPWWQGQRCGSVVDARLGLLDFGPGGQPCALLDGLLLATSQPLAWDEGYPGWHLYDHDACRQLLERGRVNWCLRDGAALVRHNRSSPTDVGRLDGWEQGVARFHGKWRRDR